MLHRPAGSQWFDYYIPFYVREKISVPYFPNFSRCIGVPSYGQCANIDIQIWLTFLAHSVSCNIYVQILIYVVVEMSYLFNIADQRVAVLFPVGLERVLAGELITAEL